jgi:hypothetical protein
MAETRRGLIRHTRESLQERKKKKDGQVSDKNIEQTFAQKEGEGPKNDGNVGIYINQTG